MPSLEAEDVIRLAEKGERNPFLAGPSLALISMFMLWMISEVKKRWSSISEVRFSCLA